MLTQQQNLAITQYNIKQKRYHIKYKYNKLRFLGTIVINISDYKSNTVNWCHKYGYIWTSLTWSWMSCFLR
jgi:hypothetical protein